MVNPFETLPGLLRDKAQKRPSRVALRVKEYGIWREISWREYWDQVQSFALGLISLGLEPGDRVSILGDNCPEWLYADLAAQAAGGMGVGIYPSNPPPEVEYVLSHSESKFVVVYDQEQLDKVLAVKESLPFLRRAVVIDTKGLRHYHDPLIASFAEVSSLGRDLGSRRPELFEARWADLDPDEVAIMIYTSGTTGPPKGAMLSHRNLMTMVDQWIRATPMFEDDNAVSYLPLCHVLERVMSLAIPLRVGYTVNFAESIDTVQQALREIAPTIFVGVPRIWEKMYSNHVVKMEESTPLKRIIYNLFMTVGDRIATLRSEGQPVGLWLSLLAALGDLFVFGAIRDQLGLRRAHFAMCGAAPTAPEIKKFFNSIGLKLREAYGQTEASGLVSIHTGDDIKFGTVGRVADSVELKIAGDGEILLRGPTVFKAYFKNPGATDEALKDGWLHTGDVGCLGEDGHLRITDRKKDIIITAGGKNISPQEIENKLKVSPYVKDAIVIGDRRKYLTALIEIDYDNVGHWAETKGIPYTNFKDLARNLQVKDLIQEVVGAISRQLSSVEEIKKFTLLEKQLDQDDEELTATQKVRRQVVEKKYAQLIEEMYR